MRLLPLAALRRDREHVYFKFEDLTQVTQHNMDIYLDVEIYRYTTQQKNLKI